MVLPGDDCDECSAAYLGHGSRPSTAVIISLLPFFLSFLFAATLVFQRLFPLLSGGITTNTPPQISLSTFDLRAAPSSGTKNGANAPIRPLQRISAYTFSITIALSTVLAELILCEISGTSNKSARGIALRTTITLLLVFLVVVIPSVEIYSIVSSCGWKYTGKQAGRFKMAWVVHGVAFGAWIAAFWYTGHLMLARHHNDMRGHDHGGLVNITTENVGVIGISLMALLSGFASISTPWQCFGVRQAAVSETTLARKAAGLESTNEMLATKRSRLRALERKMSTTAPEGFLKKAMGSFRGSADVTERKALEMEISGLENMALSLSTSHSILAARLAQQRRAQTALGHLLRVFEYGFALYCLYRIVTVCITFWRRHATAPDTVFRQADPINNIMALLIKHYDPYLDRDAWTRQISFLLSGVMLFASFNSVLQTLHLFARFAPSLLRAAQANLALIVAQMCATYVVSVGILLQGIMPGLVGLKGLGGGDLMWVDAWFEGWFLLGAGVTGVGIWLGRKVLGGEDWDDFDDDVEAGKRS